MLQARETNLVSRSHVAYHDEGKTTTLLYKNIYVFILLWTQGCCGVRDRQREGDKDRMLYWLITSSSLDYTMLCYLQDPHLALLQLLGSEYSTGGLLWAAAPVMLSQWLPAGSDSRLTLTPTAQTFTRASAYIIS